MVQYGLLCTVVLNGVWYVVDAINGHSNFFISSPADHAKQLQIMSELKPVPSKISIWIHKPSFKDAERSGTGLKKLTVAGSTNLGRTAKLWLISKGGSWIF